MDIATTVTARPLASPGMSPRGVAATTEASARADELDAAAEGFEKLLVQRLLKEARATSFGDAPSNARSTWDSMYDEAIAGAIVERGTLGFADAIRQSLESSGAVAIAQPKSASVDVSKDTPTATANGNLDPASLGALRRLIESDSTPRADGAGESPARLAAALFSAPPSDSAPVAGDDAWAGPALAALAALAAPERLARPETDDRVAQQRAFLDGLRPHAEREAARLNVPGEVILAVAAHESGWGRYPIVDERGTDSHNLFGIKSHGRDGPSVTRATTEYLGGSPRTVMAEFRAYENPGESVTDFARFLLENPRYRSALAEAPHAERFLEGLQAAGYATDPAYADKAIRTLERVRELLAHEGGKAEAPSP